MADFELTRRDAIVALGASGVAVGALGALTWANAPDPIGERERETLEAVALAVYPSEVTGVQGFVERVVVGRLQERSEHAAGVAEAVTTLNDYSERWANAPYHELSPTRQEEILSEFGVDVSDPDPHGAPAERVRYYLVNDLLYALFTSPTGGELVGLENPQGHPGGIGSYQRPEPDGES